jgi:DNA-binding GntR family transcriptional regulator
MAQRLAPLTEKPESLTQMVYQALRDAIISKRLPPGERVSEASLARQLRVSKTPVREALLRLNAIGLIEADGGRGGRIVRPSAESIRHTYEVRGSLESLAARLAAARADQAQRSQLLQLAAASLAAAQEQDLDGFQRHDEAFHDVLAAASSNPYLARLIDNAYTLTGAVRQRDVPGASDSIDCAAGHVRIADAIARGDSAAAEAEAAAHVEMVGLFVLQAFLDASEPGHAMTSNVNERAENS